jgi:hypothetical protein
MTVHNQYPEIELVSPVYFCNYSTYYEYPVERTDVGTVMKISFRFNLDQDESSGILMYELRRKSNARSGHQSSIDIISAKAIEEALKMTRLLVTWDIKCSGGPRVNLVLVEYNESVLSEDKLARLYDKVKDIRSVHCLTSCTWLMCDDTALNIHRELVLKRGIESKITISEGVKDRHTVKPMWIGLERQVLLEAIYTFANLHCSLTFQSAVDVTIDNQFSNVKLTSPVYFIKDATCHIQFPRQVNTSSIMKVNFRAGIDRDMFGGALLYHLQREEDAPIIAQLLVIWGHKFHIPYSDTWLIKHEDTFVWNEDKLKKLHDAYVSQYGASLRVTDWLLDDNTKLQTVHETSHEGFEMRVIISRLISLPPYMEPLLIDSNR